MSKKLEKANSPPVVLVKRSDSVPSFGRVTRQNSKQSNHETPAQDSISRPKRPAKKSTKASAAKKEDEDDGIHRDFEELLGKRPTTHKKQPRVMVQDDKSSQESSSEEYQAEEDDEEYSADDVNGKKKAYAKSPSKRQVKAKVKEEFKRPQDVRAVVKKEINLPLVKKEEGQKTLVEIIEDARTGRPAKSEIESKEKKAFLKKAGLVGSIKSHTQGPRSETGGASIVSGLKKQASVISATNDQQSPQPKPTATVHQILPKLVMVNGKMVVQSAPTVNIIQQNRDQALALHNEAREIQVVDPNSGSYSGHKLSSLSFLNRQPAEKWKPEETDKFFMALQIIGTDFTMIERIFQGLRSREQIKNKFRKEERKNKKHIDQLLKNKERLTLKDFQDKYGKIKFTEEEMQSSESEAESEVADASSSSYEEDSLQSSEQLQDIRSKGPQLLNQPKNGGVSKIPNQPPPMSSNGNGVGFMKFF